MPSQRLANLNLILISVISILIWSVSSQSLLPPAKYDGFLYKHVHVDDDSILIEAFYDPVCPDSRDSWSPLKQILHYYGSRTSLVLHLLPLPYHDNAYASSRALHIANLLNASSTFPLLERFFKHQVRIATLNTVLYEEYAYGTVILDGKLARKLVDFI